MAAGYAGDPLVMMRTLALAGKSSVSVNIRMPDLPASARRRMDIQRPNWKPC